MRRQWKNVIFYLICFLLQVFLRTLLPGLSAVPDVVLIMTAGLMFLSEEREQWMVYGLIFALIWDMVFGLYIGMGFAASLAVYLLVLAFLRNFQAEGFVLYLIYLAAVTLLYMLLFWVFSRIGGAPYGLLYVLKGYPARAIGNLIAGLILYYLSARENVRLRRKNWYR